MPSAGERCGGSFSLDADGELIGEYDLRSRSCRSTLMLSTATACCQHCGVEAKAPASAVATATPFGPRIHALAIYLKGFQALSYERLRGLFGDAFGLSVSEGALMNDMFIRSHARFKIEAERAKAILRAAVVAMTRPASASLNELVSLGVPLQGRGGASARYLAARVVDDMMAGYVLEV